MASDEQKQKQTQSMAEEALLKQPLVQQPEPEDIEGEGASISPVEMTGFAFLTFSSAMAVSSCHRGFGAVSFIVFAYLDLVMLFHCLRLYARTPPGSSRREVLRMAAWLLAMLLNIAFFQLLEFWVLTMGETDLYDQESSIG